MPRSRAALALVALAALAATLLTLRRPPAEPIRIGVLHAQSGVMAQSERGLIDALRLAAEEINAAGGVLDRPLELVLADSLSDSAREAAEAERLIREERVAALFGCWTSACRKAVRPVVEGHGQLMFYPLQYEGMEQSPNIVYLGAAPNQQIIPGARWALDTFGRRVYLVGSDYVFPRTANHLVRDLVGAAGGAVLGERYLPFAATDFEAVAADIRRQAPDVILNTINGAGNRAFFAALANAGLGTIPVVSFSIAEAELRAIGSDYFHPAHHTVWGYFQSLQEPGNPAFVAAFKRRFGDGQVTSDPIVASYTGLHLWAAAAREARSAAPEQVRQAIGRTTFAGPAGLVAVDPATHHLWRRVYVGHARADGQFDAIEISETAVRPTPFPPYRSREQWLELVGRLSAPPAGAGGHAQ